MPSLLPHERTRAAGATLANRFTAPGSVHLTAGAQSASARREDTVSQGPVDSWPVLVESRTITGDRRALSVLAADLRKRSVDHTGHLEEVHFQNEGDRIRFLVLWRSPVDLRDFVTGSHSDVLSFRTATGTFPGVERTLWWAAPGAPVTFTEADERAGHLHEHGPGQQAFTLRSPVPPPE